MAGKIIVIEGIDCSGKQTQVDLLITRLKNMGKKCECYSFPMYNTPTGKILGGPYLGKPEICKSYFEEGPANVNPYIACLYYAADRKYNIDKILNSLEELDFVILDRYTTSNLAHQGSKIRNKDERFNMYQWIDKLEYWLLKLPKPDKTIFLHMPSEFSIGLMRNRDLLDDAELNLEHLKNAEETYIELSELYNWNIIECIKDEKIREIEDINNEILDIVTNNK